MRENLSVQCCKKIVLPSIISIVLLCCRYIDCRRGRICIVLIDRLMIFSGKLIILVLIIINTIFTYVEMENKTFAPSFIY